jgi:sec-independent protein translocase protein TatC
MLKEMSEKDKGEMSFLEHLEELRWHIIRSLFVIVLLSILTFVFKRFVFDVIILGPSKSDFITNRLLCRMGGILHTTQLCLNTKPIKLQSIEMAGQFLAHIKISIIAGFIISFPYVFYEFWKFVRPALHKGERIVARGAVITISILFFLGILFGYYIICPLSVNFLINYRVSDLAENNIKLMSYVSTVANIALSGGIAFELPVIIYALSEIGLITPEFLKKYRRHAIIVILIIAAIITPPDVFSQTLVALPLVLLYELSIGISRRINSKKKKEQEKILSG